MIRVLVVEDSGTARELLLAILGSRPREFAVVGVGRDGREGVELTQQLRPDIVTMDIRMPVLDGLAATRQIMATAPTPVVVVSGSEVLEVETSLEALRAGALAVVEKPRGPETPGFEERCAELLQTFRLMAGVKVVRRFDGAQALRQAAARRERAASAGQRFEVVAIATSTGGPAALQTILSQLPRGFPAPVLVVQHIARGFVGGLASWLGSTSELRVKIAQDGEPALAGVVYVAPDDRQLGLTQDRRIATSSERGQDGFRPSASFLFDSVARAAGGGTLAVILTGMGRDGVEGLRRVRALGGRIVAQDEASSIVFGMPAAAIQAGLADEVVALPEVGARLVSLVAP